MGIVTRFFCFIILCSLFWEIYYKENEGDGNFKVVINERIMINGRIHPLSFFIQPNGSLTGDKGHEFTDEELSRLFANNTHDEYKAMLYISDYDKVTIGSIENALKRLKSVSNKKKRTIISLRLPEIFKPKF